MANRNCIAALVENMGPSQKNFHMIKKFNEIAQSSSTSVTCFYSNLTVPVSNAFFACMNMSGFSSYKGIAISTDLETTQAMMKTTANANKFYYVWDLEWLYQTISYETVQSILQDESLQILARSESHAKLIENFSNKKISGIVDNWNIQQLMEVTNGNR